LRYHPRIEILSSRLAGWAAPAFFIVALAISGWMVAGGAAGWLYLLCYSVAVIPGLPLGFALFGRTHAGGWIAGMSIGYALTALALWAAIAAHVPSTAVFLFAWVLTTALTRFLAPRSTTPLVALPPWTRSASAGLLIVLTLTLAVAAPPLSNVGRSDADGNRYYRAYFTADFVWHTALTAEVAKFSMPPRNPYLQHHPVHYYWTYYLFPAVVSARGPAPLGDVQRCLKLNALATGLVLMSAVFLAAWAVVGRAIPVVIATALALLSSSAEGLYALFRIWARGDPLASVRDLNIDAITSWWFGGHRIDGLQRCIWYVPQHGMSDALGLIAMAVAVASRSSAPASAIALAGISLGGSVLFNPFVGGIFALAYGISIALDTARQPRPLINIARHLLAIIPVAAAIAWSAANQMLAGAGGVLQFGLTGSYRAHPLVTLLLSLGPILVIAGAGWMPSRAVPFRSVVPSLVAAALSLAAMYFVQLSVDREWVSFRMGHLFIVVAAMPAAACIAGGWTARRKAVTAVVVLLCLGAGLPTTVVDEYNAQDIHNFDMAPGFPWTIVVTRQQQAAYRWIRENTPQTAVVQMDAAARGRSTWSNIPSFAERRMAAGLPISLLDVPEYHERSARVAVMYETSDAAMAADIARKLRIEYVYVDEVERSAHPHGIAFDGSPYFEHVFEDPPVAVYRVR
jgi:hypothetical protein